MLFVSVIIPTFNRAHLITRAIDSVMSQIVENDEIIVVDDGSQDDTAEVLKKYGQKIRYIKQINSGAGTARNRGITEARNPLIAFLDSDDEWKNGKLDLQRRFLEQRNDIVFCFSDLSRKNADGIEEHNHIRNWLNGYTNLSDVTEMGQILGDPVPYSQLTTLPAGMEEFNVYIGDIYHYELFNNCISTITVLVNRQRAGNSLHFGGNIKLFEDWQCFGMMASRGPVAFLGTETATQISHSGYRLTHHDSVTSLKTRLIVTQRVWGSDKDFLKNYPKDYEFVIKQLQLSLVRAQFARGKNREARHLLSQIRNSPAHYRIMASLPSPIISGIRTIKRLIA